MSNNKSCCSLNRHVIGNRFSTPISNEIELKKNNKKINDNMIYIPGGDFLMGSEDITINPGEGENPVRKVKLSPYYIDSTAVTNHEFNAFVNETKYKTEAEKFGWSFIFHMFISKEQRFNAKQIKQAPWWFALKETYWFQPEGPGSSIKNKMDHPVIHVSWNDAIAFCNWAGKRLPTEAEWEYASRGGLVQKNFPWGNELNPENEHQCNIWQGVFPYQNTKEDGYLGIAPAKSYPPNGFGLYNMSGNVWEWCSDWFSTEANLKEINNPKGPSYGDSKVVRGGSYLCHKSYCNRYRTSARSSNTIDTSSGNLGFRCAKNVN